MFRFIKPISITVQFLIPFLAVVAFIPGLIIGFQGGQGNSGPGRFYIPSDDLLYDLWSRTLTWHPWIHLIINCLIVIGLTFLMVRTDLRHQLMGQRSYAAGFIFVFLVASTGQLDVFHPAFLAFVFLLIGYGFMLAHYKTESNYSYSFGVGFAIGVGMLLYPPLIIIFPLLGAGIGLLVSTTWRHWASLIWGLVIPPGIAAFVLALTGDLAYQAGSFLDWFEFSLELPPDLIREQPFLAAWFGLILIWIIIASIGYRNPRIQSRQLFMVNFFLFIILVAASLFMKSISSEITWFLIIPVSFLITFWSLNVKKGWLRDLFFLSMIGSWIFLQLKDLITGD